MIDLPGPEFGSVLGPARDERPPLPRRSAEESRKLDLSISDRIAL